MSLTVKVESSYTPPPPGTYWARCYGVIDLGTQPDQTYGPRPKVMLMFELPHERIKFMDNGVEKERPATMMKEYTASLGKKADLRKHLDTWRGKPFSEDELKGFHLPNVLTAPCSVSIIHTPKLTGGINAKISGIQAVPKGTTVPELFNPVIEFDLDDGMDSDGFKALPEWLRNKISKCAEWTEDAPPPPDTADSTPDPNDDVPF